MSTQEIEATHVEKNVEKKPTSLNKKPISLPIESFARWPELDCSLQPTPPGHTPPHQDTPSKAFIEP